MNINLSLSPANTIINKLAVLFFKISLRIVREPQPGDMVIFTVEDRTNFDRLGHFFHIIGEYYPKSRFIMVQKGMTVDKIPYNEIMKMGYVRMDWANRSAVNVQ